MGRHKILIVDDHEDGRKLVRMFVKHLGYEVTEAADGRQALAQVAADKPDLILMDLFMPHIGGQEVIVRLKADPETSNIPILVLTASNHPAVAKMALQAGGVDVLTKPLDLMELDRIIAAHVR